MRHRTKALAVLLTFLVLAGCKDGIRRGGADYEGSAQWALDIARPTINTFAPNAPLYTITGSRIDTTGRLFTNVGAWSFQVWSQSQGKSFTVTVDNNGRVTTKTEVRATPPGRGTPIPAGWLNSTDVFRAAQPHVNDSPKEVTFALFNSASYPEAPNDAVWGLSYSTPGGAHKVKWDGTYLSGS